MADPDISDLAAALSVEQILLRTFMREVVRRLAQQSPDPAKAVREIAESLHESIDLSGLRDVAPERLERAKEQARLNFDALLRSLL